MLYLTLLVGLHVQSILFAGNGRKLLKLRNFSLKVMRKPFDQRRSPFLQLRHEGERNSIPILTKDAVLEDVEGRFAVLETLLTFSTHDLRISNILSNAFPLYTQEDLSLAV